MKHLDIVIPVKNEAANVAALIRRIDASLKKNKLKYQAIFIDDHSSDSTVKQLNELSKKYPVIVKTKIGKPGKSYSILEGVKHAKSEFVAMIDGDLQYPPEAISDMIELTNKHGIVVANRRRLSTSWIRSLFSRIYALVFGRLLLGFSCDIQSGLKVFRRELALLIDPTEVTPWTIDLALLNTAKDLGYSIGSVDIDFSPRQNGASKINLLRASCEIGLHALKSRLSHRKIYHLPSLSSKSMVGAGIAFKNRQFITHTNLHSRHSAITTLSGWQKTSLIVFLGIFVAGLIISPLNTIGLIIAVLSTIYFLDTIFNLFLVLKSLHFPPEIVVSDTQLNSLKSKSLPIYTILCPLYKEVQILPHFLSAIHNLDWPKNKLDVILLLEEDDTETIQAASQMDLPSYVRILVVPDSQPKTKPKACNFGLAHALGEFVVIYDAEDQPDPAQLKKAFIAFNQTSPKVVCLQAKLNYYNPHHNLLTRLFTAEYSLWFDIILTGLQSIETSIPLGGTSNHFRTADLVKLQGWDPFNVTEDCDLGVRIFKQGYKTAIIDSVTLEEANSHLGNWLRQRSRWIKGYIQTYFVHMRNPLELVRTQGVHSLIFQLVVGGKISFIFINPILWLATISYFVLYGVVGPTIESLYPTPVFYMAATSLVFGNFLFLYYYMIGAAKRGHWSLIKYVFFIPLYWLMVSIAGFKALIQLVYKPHYWEKTHHGLHLSAPIPHRLTLSNLQNKISSLKENLVSKPQLLSGGFLVAATGIASIFNLIYNAYLSRNLNLSDFGVLSLIGSFVYVSQIPIGALSSTVTFRSGYLFGRHNKVVKAFWSHIRPKVMVVALVGTGIWLILTPILAQIFKVNSFLPFILFAPIWLISAVAAVDSGFLSGHHKFFTLSAMVTSEAILKFIFTWVFVTTNNPHLIYSAIPLSAFSSLLIGWLIIKSTPAGLRHLSSGITRFPKKFYLTSILQRLSYIAFLSLDVIMAKIFLSPDQAGKYALISLVGKIVYFVGTLFGQFITPIVSKTEGAGQNSKKTFYFILAATSLVSLLGFVMVGLFAPLTVPRLFGDNTLSILSHLPVYTFAMVCFTIASSISNYHQVKRQYAFTFVGFVLALIQVPLVNQFHSDISSIVWVVFALSVVYLILVTFMHIFQNTFKTVLLNLLDFVGLFTIFPREKSVATGKLRILVLNWYDIKHRWSGGAEIYIHEVAKNWVKQGHSVTLFAGNDQKNLRHEIVDGINIIRRGGQFTVALWAFIYYIFKFRNKFDVVVDIPKGVPFFTPLYSRKPIVCLIHQVHQEMFRTELIFPLKQISMFLEGKLMPFVYRKVQIVAVSTSTKEAIESIGLGKHQNIDIVNPGVDIKPTKIAKTKTPSVLYLGRLRPYKFVDLLIMAVANAKTQIPNLKLVIAGVGEDEKRLKNIAHKLDLNDSVIFAGKVTDKEKSRLFTQSWIAVQPSMVEGWGITNIEANICGTPVIAANASGLKDSVLHGQTGLLVKPGDPDAIEEAIIKLVKKDYLRSRLTKNAKIWAKNFSWEASSIKFMNIIQHLLINNFNYRFTSQLAVQE